MRLSEYDTLTNSDFWDTTERPSTDEKVTASRSGVDGTAVAKEERRCDPHMNPGVNTDG